MAEITRRRTGEMLRMLFDILIAQPEGVRAREALTNLKEKLELSDYEKGAFESGQSRFDQIVRFATVDCVKAAWMIKQKGIWLVTEEGKKAHSQLLDPEEFYRQAVKLYGVWKASQPGSEPETVEEADDSVSGKAVSITFEQAEEQAWGEIEQYLREMNPYDFQDLVASLLVAMGYHVSWVSPPGKDGGVDIIAWSDPLGTRPPRIKVQVKRVAQNVTVDGLRSFMALLGADDVGLFVTTSGFTKDAHDEARNQQSRKITLVDLQRLIELWIEYYDRLKDGDKRRLPLKPIYFLAPLT